MTLRYLSTKLAGAGFALTVFFMYLLFVENFNLYNFVETISNWWIWGIIFVYGIISSSIIDWLSKKWSIINSNKIVAYILAGFLFFFIFGISIFAVIAGIVGAIVAVIFLSGVWLAKHSKKFTTVFIIMPLFFLVLIQFDFTVKKGWQETRNDEEYRATFKHFNGEHKIPFELDRGDVLTYTVNFYSNNGGGYGNSFQSEQRNLMGQTLLDDYTLQVEIEKAGTYNIVLTGDKLAGSFTVTWTIEKALNK
ncbi:hypothetical protein [Solibacillus sp. CAU 1738]|uniref:hypothetical protein n=1 Tax=Solibacillus sp. CAU 1738 TaxID=3140363 RepID=UPI003261B7BE